MASNTSNVTFKNNTAMAFPEDTYKTYIVAGVYGGAVLIIMFALWLYQWILKCRNDRNIDAQQNQPLPVRNQQNGDVVRRYSPIDEPEPQ